jgi:hypothetical protein
MKINKINFTRPSVVWLETILYERYGHKFNLRINTFGDWELSLSISERVISFPVYASTFRSADSNLPISHWDASAEGWRSVLDSPIPAPGVSYLPYPLIKETSLGVHLAYDLLGLTYWMLSRQEEVGRVDLDEHDRFPAFSSHAFKYGYLERPIVDEWLHILSQVIQRIWPNLPIKQHIFSMHVSHDVDRPSLYAFQPWGRIVRMMAGNLVKRRDILSFIQAPYIKFTTKDSLHKWDPFNTFKWLMDRSDDHGKRCTFYFLSDQTSTLHDADYNLNSLIIRNLIKYIHSRGHEIGLHPSYNSYLDPEQIKIELELLQNLLEAEGIEQNSIGGRMHYLRWKQPITLKAFADAGLSYDSTLGYADRPGFRCGTCFEYPAFDPVAQEQLKLRIRPLILMEGTIIESAYLGLGVSDSAEQKMRNLKDTCKLVGGNFEFLWHNSFLTTHRLSEMYVNLVKY